MRALNAEVLVDLVSSLDNHGEFSLFLGAGSSIGAGVPSAGSILLDAKKRLFELSCRRTPASDDELELWLSSQNLLRDEDMAYSDALELLRPTPRLRRRYLQKYFEGKQPSPAHWALAKLMHTGTFRAIYTTNFDPLVENAMRELGETRIVSYDEQVDDFGDGEGVPTVFKLHGDYLFDRLLNTAAELRSLGPSQERKLRTACSQGGLIVAGYSGRDESIMGPLTAAAVEGPPLGLYWLVRRGSTPSKAVQDLLNSSDNCFICEMDGFDEFIAELYQADDKARSTTRATNIAVPGRGDPFIAHEAGVLRLIESIKNALNRSTVSMVCLSGLPGVGKTVTARKVVNELASHFRGQVVVSGRDRTVTREDLIDEIYRQLSLTRDRVHLIDHVIAKIDDYLASRPTLFLVDNLDEIDDEAARFLGSVPEPSKVLVTLRDTGKLRSLCKHLWEVEHRGLIDSEMRDLLYAWAERSPTITRKLDRAGSIQIEDFLAQAKGWPEALLVQLNRLSSSTESLSDLVSDQSGGAYEDLLESMYGALTPASKSVLLASGHFPASFTTVGISAVCALDHSVVKHEIPRLIDAHVVREISNRLYTWAHPIVREFVKDRAMSLEPAPSMSQAVEEYLVDWAREHGGQPNSDWSNFVALDLEFENIRAWMNDAYSKQRFSVVTLLYRNLFSYIVERGYWSFTETWCQRATDSKIGKTDLTDWLIWWSWIQLYLRQNPTDSLSLAQRALRLNPRQNRQIFEGHRRSLLAAGKLGNYDLAMMHLEHARDVANHAWRRDSDQAVDLLNSEGSMYLDVARHRGDRRLATQAIAAFETAENVSKLRRNPNTREIGVAKLGQARALKELGSIDIALELAQDALALAWKMSWLRGIEECNELVGELATVLGMTELARSARHQARDMSERLRND